METAFYSFIKKSKMAASTDAGVSISSLPTPVLLGVSAFLSSKDRLSFMLSKYEMSESMLLSNYGVAYKPPTEVDASDAGCNVALSKKDAEVRAIV